MIIPILTPLLIIITPFINAAFLLIWNLQIKQLLFSACQKCQSLVTTVKKRSYVRLKTEGNWRGRTWQLHLLLCLSQVMFYPLVPLETTGLFSRMNHCSSNYKYAIVGQIYHQNSHDYILCKMNLPVVYAMFHAFQEEDAIITNTAYLYTCVVLTRNK